MTLLRSDLGDGDPPGRPGRSGIDRNRRGCHADYISASSQASGLGRDASSDICEGATVRPSRWSGGCGWRQRGGPSNGHVPARPEQARRQGVAVCLWRLRCAREQRCCKGGPDEAGQGQNPFCFPWRSCVVLLAAILLVPDQICPPPQDMLVWEATVKGVPLGCRYKYLAADPRCLRAQSRYSVTISLVMRMVLLRAFCKPCVGACSDAWWRPGSVVATTMRPTAHPNYALRCPIPDPPHYWIS